MKLGITGPDLLILSGGGQTYTINVIRILNKKYDIVYFPDASLYRKYRLNKKYVMERAHELESKDIKITDFFFELLETKSSYSDIVTKYASEKVDFIFAFDLPDFFSYSFTVDLARKMDVKFAANIMGLGDFDLHLFSYIYSTLMLSKRPAIFLYRLYHFFDRKILIMKIERSRDLAFISFLNNHYFKNVKIKFPRLEILSPGSGISNFTENINEYIEKKCNRIIFVARLIYSKGTFDIVPILRYISTKTDIKLELIGNFEYEREKELFFKLVEKSGLNNLVVYKGFLPNEELYAELSGSNVLLYPSHADSYSLVIAQALALKTPVVAYDIPGLEIYKGMKAVKLVKEFDYKSMAEEVLKLLEAKDTGNLFDDSVDKFIKEHTWENVAKQYDAFFRKYKDLLAGS